MDGHISRSSILYGSAEDIWPDMEHLYRDQLYETCQKLSQLDDEIWGKVILMERNKRVAKAYIRAQVVTVDGSTSAFDGYRLGFAAFDNQFRDKQMHETHLKIGQGVRLKMDQQGNILAKRIGTCSVIVHGVSHPEQYCVSPEVIKANGHLPLEKPVKVFDMNVFKNAIRTELQLSYPDRKKLLFKTIVSVSFLRASSNPLNAPCWFLLINLVAVDMLNSQVPPIPTSLQPLMCRRQSDALLSDLKTNASSTNAGSEAYASVGSLGGNSPWPPVQTAAASAATFGLPSAYANSVAAWYGQQPPPVQHQPIVSSAEQLAQLANAFALGFQPVSASRGSGTNSSNNGNAMIDSQTAAFLWQRQQTAATAISNGYASECEPPSRNRPGRPKSEAGFRPLTRSWPTAQSTESLYGPLNQCDNIPSSAASISNFTLRPKTPFSSSSGASHCSSNGLSSSKKLFNAAHYRNFKPSNWSTGSMSDYECSQTYDSSPYSSNTSAASGRPSSPSIVSEVSANESPSDSGYTEEAESSRSIRLRSTNEPSSKTFVLGAKKREKAAQGNSDGKSSLSSSSASSSTSTSPSSASSEGDLHGTSLGQLSSSDDDDESTEERTNVCSRRMHKSSSAAKSSEQRRSEHSSANPVLQAESAKSVSRTGDASTTSVVNAPPTRPIRVKRLQAKQAAVIAEKTAASALDPLLMCSF